MARYMQSLYPHYRRIWTFGMSYSSPDGQMRKGLIKYRGRTKKWLLRDIGYPLHEIEKLKAEEITCDLLVGRLHEKEHAERFASLGAPIVDLQCTTEHPGVIRTHQLDFRAGGRLAAQHMLRLGYRNFTFLTYARQMGWAESVAWEGFREEAEPHAATLDLIVRPKREHISMKPDRTIRELTSISAWLREMERPMAVLLFESRMAQEVCQFASFSGVSIPEDLALIGMQDDPLICETCMPSLSSIQYPAEYWGYRIGEHVDALLNGQDPGEIMAIPPSQITERNSTGLVVIEDQLVARGLALMRHHAPSRLTITEMLQELPLTQRAFQLRFRKAIGRSPMEELFRIRVELARHYMVETDYTVERVAESCGFRHAESMSKYFKQWTGQTPTQYRRQNLGRP